MTAVNRWIAVSAVSALGMGILATSAIGVANAMPLSDTSGTADVPPISTLSADSKGTIGTDTVSFPVPASAPAGASVPTAASAPAVEQAPAPAPQPVAPLPAAPASAASVVSPSSAD